MVIPFFSIIVPTFNSQSTIYFAIQSILEQSFSDFEILVIDGFSADQTIVILNNFDDQRLKIISGKDSGIYDAMNKGVSLAKGEWLFFLGSDDTLYSNDVLMNIFHIIEKSYCKVIYGNVLISGDAGWASNNSIYDGKFSLKKLLKKNICHQSIFYKKEVFNKKVFDVNYRLCADYDLNIFLWSRYRFQYIPLVISIFNGGGTSSELIDNKFSQDFKDNLKRYFKFWFLIPELFYFLNQKGIQKIFYRFKTMFKF